MNKLTNEELIELYQKDKCETVFNELYVRNKGLIHNIILKYRNNIVVNKDDIDSACHLGFTQAVNGYKVGSECKFSTYCHQAMLNEVNNSVNHEKRKMRNNLDQSFIYLDDVANEGEANPISEVIDLSSKDVMVKKDYTYLYDAIEYAKGFIMDKYHRYLVPILYKEISTYEVADLIGIIRQTVQYTITRFKRLVADYIDNYFSEIEKVSS